MKVKVTPVSSDSGHKPVFVCRAGFGHISPFGSLAIRYRLLWMCIRCGTIVIVQIYTSQGNMDWFVRRTAASIISAIIKLQLHDIII